RLSCSGERTVQPAFGRGLLLAGDGGGDLAAYDPATGKQVWCDDESGSITSAPAVTDDTVYITNGGDAIAIDQFTGTRRWTFTPADFSPLTETPAIAEGRVFVNAEDPQFGLWAFDAQNGAFLWRSEKPDEPEATVTVANGVVYDIADDGELMMFEAALGTFLGSLADPDGKPFRSVFGSQPIVANGTVYVATGDFQSPNRVDAFHLPS